MSNKAIDWQAVAASWASIEAQLGKISFAQTVANAERMRELMDALLVATEDENCAPALHSMLDCISDWVMAYEASHVAFEESTPAELLQHLMQSNGLKQRDLADIFGGQPVVSAVLRGDRSINAKQARRLGDRFGISPAAFIPKDEPASEPSHDFSVRCVSDTGTATTLGQSSVHWVLEHSVALTH